MESAPVELKALPDDALIEKIGREVMGWRREFGEELGLRNEDADGGNVEAAEWWYVLRRGFNGELHETVSDIQHAVKDWNPLTDWNHTVAVMKVTHAKIGDALFEALDAWEPRPDAMWSPGAQRAICLAALLAVSAR